MSLSEIVWADAKIILAEQYGPGQAITVTNPSGVTKEINGFYNDISQVIDPETGQFFSGRSVTVTFSLLDLASAGLGIPRGISDPGSKPWIVELSDVAGNEYKFKVAASYPDRSRGVVSCDLEVYE